MYKSICKSLGLGLILFVALLSGCATKTGTEAFQGMSAQQILTAGEKQLHKHNYREASRHFEALEALYPFSHECERGQIDIIYAYYQDSEYAEAVVAAEHYLHLYPRGKYADYAYYMKGMSNFETGPSWVQKLYNKDPSRHDLTSMREAFNDFSDLISVYPKSKYAQDGRKRMIYVRNIIAKHEIRVAKFYMQRKAYVAAANRASYVVRHLQGSDEVKDALQIMIKAYGKLGAKAQLLHTQKIYKMNFRIGD